MSKPAAKIDHSAAQSWLTRLQGVLDELPEGYTLQYAPDGQQLFVVSEAERQAWLEGDGTEDYYPSRLTKPIAACTPYLPRVQPADD